MTPDQHSDLSIITRAHLMLKVTLLDMCDNLSSQIQPIIIGHYFIVEIFIECLRTMQHYHMAWCPEQNRAQ